MWIACVLKHIPSCTKKDLPPCLTAACVESSLEVRVVGRVNLAVWIARKEEMSFLLRNNFSEQLVNTHEQYKLHLARMDRHFWLNALAIDLLQHITSGCTESVSSTAKNNALEYFLK